MIQEIIEGIIKLPLKKCSFDLIQESNIYYLIFPPPAQSTIPFCTLDFFVLRNGRIKVLIKAVNLKINFRTLSPIVSSVAMEDLQEAVEAGAMIYEMPCLDDYYGCGCLFDIPDDCFFALPDRTNIPGRWEDDNNLKILLWNGDVTFRVPSEMRGVLGRGEVATFLSLYWQLLEHCSLREKDAPGLLKEANDYLTRQLQNVG